MKQLSKIEIIIGCLLVLCVYALAGTNDYYDDLSAEEHAKHSMQLAQRDEAEKKAEFEYLAKKATYMTGVAVNSK
jgi:hypothetical protein